MPSFLVLSLLQLLLSEEASCEQILRDGSEIMVKSSELAALKLS